MPNKLSNQEILDDLAILIIEGEALFNTLSNSTEASLVEVKESFKKRLEIARCHYYSMVEETTIQVKKAAYNTDKYVHENPYKLMVIAGVTGLVIGGFLSCSCRK